MQRRIFIGDVHGHYDGLMALLNAIAPCSDDQVYFLGDLINRGCQSAQVVEFVRQSPYYCLLGNHEQMFLNYFQDKRVLQKALEIGRFPDSGETSDSYQKLGIFLLPVHLEWFASLPTYLDLGDVFAVHAGIHPHIPLKQQSSQEFCWIRQPFHQMSQPYFPDKLIIVGHTITFKFPGVVPGKLVQGQGWLDIDTGAYDSRSGWLTGFDITNRRVYQVNVFSNHARILPLEEAVIEI
ncbi:MAG: serine/threonine protein phosphatase [Calothrix sp. CSU_2_0]|nr:serine/threonine protein phosphatase [Calothrix sp. CSU_2_0]